jgi:hypothetical protein
MFLLSPTPNHLGGIVDAGARRPPGGFPLVIVGCGGFGREAFHIAAAVGVQVEGFFDDAPTAAALKLIANLGSMLLGSTADLARRQSSFQAVIAVGDPAARIRIAERLEGAPVSFPTLIHPDTTIAPDVVLGPGCVIAPGVRLSTNVALGEHVHVDQNATVGHDSTLCDFVRLNPQACVSGGVTVGPGALIGANATILQYLRVGEFSVIGAAACVVRDVMPRTKVKGVPAA